jgi:asparagine synthase (glutamine-hydrolysing)
MLEMMAGRSPDGRMVRCSGTLGLGHGALHTTPESLDEELPLATSEGLLITGDLRLDNRSDLLRDLSINFADGCEVGDAELVLKTYRRWGMETPTRLLGAFAFAIWDPRSRELFCARDHFGAKPFVYHLSGNLFVFASEENGVLAMHGVPRRVNEARIADFLVSELEGIDHTSTFYLDLVKLPPAHTLIVCSDSYRLNRYWSPDPSYELRLASDEEYVEAFRHTLQRAVGACLRSDAPPAVMLSGGIDSGAVAAVATELQEQRGLPRMRTLSAVNDENRDCEESACIRASIETLGTQTEVVTPAQLRSLSPERRRSVLDCGNPFDSMMTVPDLLYEKARSSGTRVVLDGVDGDVVTSLGGTHIAHLLRRGRILGALREASARGGNRADEASPWRMLVAGAWNGLAPSALRRLAQRFRGRSRSVDGAIADSIIHPDFARRIDLADRLERHERNRWFVASGDAGRDQRENLLHPYVAVGLERYDRVASRWGIDVRHPLFDLRLVELCLALPWNLKNRNGWKKYVLRLATKDALPEQVRWRRNNANVMWLFTSLILARESSFTQAVIENHASELGAYVDLDAVRAALAAFERQPSWKVGLYLSQAVALVLWLGRKPL